MTDVDVVPVGVVGHSDGDFATVAVFVEHIK